MIPWRAAPPPCWPGSWPEAAPRGTRFTAPRRLPRHGGFPPGLPPRRIRRADRTDQEDSKSSQPGGTPGPSAIFPQAPAEPHVPGHRACTQPTGGIPPPLAGSPVSRPDPQSQGRIPSLKAGAPLKAGSPLKGGSPVSRPEPHSRPDPQPQGRIPSLKAGSPASRPDPQSQARIMTCIPVPGTLRLLGGRRRLFDSDNACRIRGRHFPPKLSGHVPHTVPRRHLPFLEGGSYGS
jgi:hypothetical protein